MPSNCDEPLGAKDIVEASTQEGQGGRPGGCCMEFSRADSCLFIEDRVCCS